MFLGTVTLRPTPLTRTPHFVWQPCQLRLASAIVAAQNGTNNGADGLKVTVPVFKTKILYTLEYICITNNAYKTLFLSDKNAYTCNCQ